MILTIENWLAYIRLYEKIRKLNKCGHFCGSRKIIMYEEEIKFRKNISLIKEIKSGLLEFLDRISKLEFDKISGNLYNPELIFNVKKLYNDIDNIAKVFSNIGDPKNIECVVCNETTITETVCGHKLCLQCWNSINNLNKKCPVCRKKNLNFIGEYEYNHFVVSKKIKTK